MTTPQDTMEAVGNAAAERDERVALLLEAQLRGTLSDADRRELEAMAARDSEVAAMMSACRPEDLEGQVDDILARRTTPIPDASHGNVISLDSRRAARRRTLGMVAAAALAVASFALLFGQPEWLAPALDGMPAYTVEWRASAGEFRSNEPVALPELEGSDTLVVTLRPERAAADDSRAALFGVTGPNAKLLTPFRSKGRKGAFEATLSAAELLEHPPESLVAIIAPSDATDVAMAAAAVDDESVAEGWRRLPVELTAKQP